jgi:hypothetical protein
MHSVHDDVNRAWERAVEQWDDVARHDALLAVVVQHSEFAWAAARYKERGDDAIAKERLERLGKAATATMFATAKVRETPDSSPYKKMMLWLVAMVVMLVVGLLFARIVVNNRPAKSSTKRAPPTSTPAQHPTPARH